MTNVFNKVVGGLLGLYGVANLAFNGSKLAYAASFGVLAVPSAIALGIGVLALYGSYKMLKDDSPSLAKA